MLDSREQCTVVLKVKFKRNHKSLEVTNNTQETVIFDPKEMIVILGFDIFRLLQNKTGCIAAKFEQMLSF